MNYKLAPLILSSGKNNVAVSDIFISQPDAVKEALAGKLFILIEVETGGPEGLKIINFLIDNLNYNYYQNEKVIMRERMPSLKVEHIFEAALAKTNKYFLDYLESEKLNIGLKRINITAGVLHDGYLYFANSGKNKIFLVYKSRAEEKEKNERKKMKIKNRPAEEAVQTDESEYRIVNVDPPGRQSTLIESEDKLFHDVICGKAPDKSSFIISNEALPEYISTQQIQKISGTLPPASAVEQLKIMLEAINSYVPFLALVIRVSSLETSENERRPVTQTAQSSIINLNRTEDSTEELLTPSGMINFKKWLRLPALLIPLLSRPNKNKLESTSGLSLKDKIIVKKKSIALAGKIFNSMKNVAIYLANAVFFLLKTLTSKSAIAGGGQRLKSSLAAKTANSAAFIQNLNLTGKILMAVAIVSVALLTANIIFLRSKNVEKQEVQNVQGIISQIEQKQNQIDANLLYNNEEGAKKLFDEISGLIAGLPQETPAEQGQYNELKMKVDSQLAKLRRITNIPEPAEIANFINLNSQSSPQNIVYSAATTKLYAADSSQKSIYIVDTKNNMSTSLTDVSQPINTLLYPTISKNGNILYINGASGVIALNPADEKLSGLPLSLSNLEVSAADIFNENLYILDAKNSRILKSALSGGSFSAPVDWLKSNIDLKNAVDISIDGQIYALLNDGQVIKLLRGKQEEFKLAAVEPAWAGPAKIQVFSDSNYLYILEPKNNRLVVFEKTGNYVMQYRSDKFSDLKDFFVDEKNKIIYVLNNTTVYSFKTEHLK